MKKNNKLYISEELKNKLLEGVKKTLEESTYGEVKLTFEGEDEPTYWDDITDAVHYYLERDFNLKEEVRAELIKYIDLTTYLEDKAEEEEQDGHKLELNYKEL